MIQSKAVFGFIRWAYSLGLADHVLHSSPAPPSSRVSPRNMRPGNSTPSAPDGSHGASGMAKLGALAAIDAFFSAGSDGRETQGRRR